jgi:hypothetical protein
MKFVELNRAFLPLRKGEAADPEVTRFWAHKYSGAVYWPELRQYHRVVLLAEASSGKTEEFRNQVTVLRADGQAAFFVSIEELADEGFEAALDPKDLAQFQKWQRSGTKGWFFLDSLDEARLNKKSFDTALRNLARVLDSSLNRAHIFISCRVSDWNGDKDRASFERLLPAYRPAPPPAEEEEDALLDPIFEKAEKKAEQKSAEKVKLPPTDLQVVRITPLVTDQYRLLATACGVAEVVKFTNAVVRNGLDMFTERPGDVIDLASYWNTHKKFGSFEKMTEYAITSKLKEEDAHRADNDVLSESKAREGAEMLAAALTFGKSFTLKVPSDSADPELAPGAIDPKLVLKNWLPAQINALSRRAVFAPATYGRIRFHHRATQEYLAAKWFFGLLKNNCPVEVVWALLFAERYGVETVVPSLHPIAGWLALWLPNFRDEIVKREPLALVRNGDPASLPIATREALLRTFAKKQADGQIYNDSLDHRALWMFADKQLDKSIRAAWKQNGRDDFRLDLLRLIREGEIYACTDLALSVVTSPAQNKYLHIVAADILKGEGKPTHLRAMATAFKRNVANLTSRVAASYVLALFPKYITVKELLAAISQVELKKKNSTDGLGYHLGELYDLCPDDAARNEFVLGLAKLCLTPPFVENYKRISAKYYELAKGLEAVARSALKRLGDGNPHAGLVALLTGVERADRHIDLDELPSISEAVRRNIKLNRALFWADAHDDRKRKGETPSKQEPRVQDAGTSFSGTR